MPLASLHLISLNPQTTLKSFITDLRSANVQPLTLAKVIRWVIIPSEISKAQLLEPVRPYDLLLITPDTKPLPGPIEAKISAHYNLTVGIPSRLLKSYSQTNQDLLHPPSSSSTPKLTGALDKPIVYSSSQSLTLSPDLQSWISSFSQTHTGQNAMSMLNLLSFHPDKRESYMKYGKAFAETIGSKRGGNAKLVGHVVDPNQQHQHQQPQSSESSEAKEKVKWDEFALAHYPSIMHFADMLASEDYQAVNQEFRVPALRDTCILCTSEVAIEEIIGSDTNHSRSKL